MRPAILSTSVPGSASAPSPPDRGRGELAGVAGLGRLGVQERDAPARARAQAVEHQPDAGRVLRVVDLLDQPAVQAERPADAGLQAQDLGGQLGRARDQRAAAGEHDARRQVAAVAGPLDLDGDELQDLLQPGLDDLGQRRLADRLVGPAADAGDLDLLVLVDHVDERHAVLALEPLGLVVQDAEPLAQVVGDLVAGDGHDGRVADRLVLEDGDVGRAAADVDEHDADLLLVVVQDGVARRQRLQHDVVDVVAGLLDAAVDVLGRRDQAGDDVDVGLEPDAAHADRVGDAVLAVDDELLGQHVQDLAVGRHGHVLGVLQQAEHVVAVDLAARDRDHAAALEALDVVAGDADDDRLGLDARGVLGRRDRLFDGLDGLVDVDDDAAVEPFGLGDADAADVDPPEVVGARDDGADLGGADVDADDDAVAGGGGTVRVGHGSGGGEGVRRGASRTRPRSSRSGAGARLARHHLPVEAQVDRLEADVGPGQDGLVPERAQAAELVGVARLGPRRTGRLPWSSTGVVHSVARRPHSISETSAWVAGSASASAARNDRQPGVGDGLRRVVGRRARQDGHVGEGGRGRGDGHREAVGVEEVARPAGAVEHQHDRDPLARPRSGACPSAGGGPGGLRPTGAAGRGRPRAQARA